MTDTMANGTFRLKGRELYIIRGLAQGTVKNKRDVMSKTGWSPVTTAQWTEKSDTLTGIDFDNFAKFVIDVLKLTPEEVLEMRVGDIFKFVPKDERPTE